MPGNVIPPPGVSPERPNGVDLPLICEAVGLPADYIDATFAKSHILPSVVTEFSGGDITVMHGPQPDPLLREKFGLRMFREGAFGSRIRAIYEGEDANLRKQVDALVRFSASVFARQLIQGELSLETRPCVTMSAHSKILRLDGYAIPLTEPPKAVLDYAPGVQGRFTIDQQLTDTQTGPTFAYMAIDKGPFANEFLQQYWLARLNEDTEKHSAVLGGIYIGREDGIAAATDELIAGQVAYTGTPEIADVVVASGLQTVDPAEIHKGIANAHKLLKPSGVLIVRAPKEANIQSADRVSAETMVGMALQAGFELDKAQFFDVETGGFDNNPVTQSLSVAFRK